MWQWISWFVALTGGSEGSSTHLGRVSQSQVSSGGAGPKVRILQAHPLRCGRRGSAEGAVGAVCPLPAKGMRTANWRGCSSTAQGGALYSEPQSLGRTGRSWDDPRGATLHRPGGVRGSGARTRKLSEAQTGDARCRRFHHPAKRRGLEVCSESDRTVHLPEQSRVGGTSSPLVVRRVQSVGVP